MSLPKLINTLIEEFLSERLITDGSSKTYRTTLNIWVRWMVQHGGITNPSTGQIVSWMKNLEEEGRTQMTIENYMKVISIFFRWLRSKGYFEDKTKGVNVKRASREYRKEYIREDVMKPWLESLKSDTVIEKRNKAIINLMVVCGFRSVEVSRFDVRDIKTTSSGYAIRIQRKGHKEKDQLVGIPSNCIDLINDYLLFRGVSDSSEPLFVSHREGQGSGRLFPYSVSQLITNELIKAKIKSKMITPHSLRHSAAAYAIKNDVPEYDIRQMLGHTSARTTERYLRMIAAEKMEVNTASRMIDEYVKNGFKKAIKTV